MKHVNLNYIKMKKINLLSAFLMLTFTVSRAETFTVTSSDDNVDSPTEGMFRYAIDNMSNGDIIVFEVDTVFLKDEIDIKYTSVTVDGGIDKAVLKGGGSNGILSVSMYSSSTSVVLKNLILTNGMSGENDYGWGGALYAFISNGELLVENCTFKNNKSYVSNDGQGGAVRSDGGTFINCKFLN